MSVAFSGSPVRIALAGNPNCGKTTAFNNYTGTRQHVGNYPGVTVDRKEGIIHFRGETVEIVDLPGTYSLTAYSQEELVSRTELTKNSPLAVINIVDSSALERNLLLTVQMLEMGVPVVLACNMMDEARAAGIHIDTKALGKGLGIPVVATVARTGEGLEEALCAALAWGREQQERRPIHLSYGPDLDPVLLSMEAGLRNAALLNDKYDPRWVALKILEGDTVVEREVRAANAELAEQLLREKAVVAEHIQSTLRTSPEAIIADYRYGYIRGLLKDGVITRDATRDRLAMSDKLDKILVHALLGPLLMLALMYAIFYATFGLGSYPQAWIETLVGWTGERVTALMPEGLLRSLLVSGIIDGVGGVLSFVPLIMIMFLFIAFLEDSGYMARIAYMVDRVFRVFGLHGMSVMPYIVSGGIAGGCAIPGVMATRTLRSPKEKLATLLTLPFMACGAKLPVFLLLSGVFFAGNEANIMMGMILAGWVFALGIARLLRSTIIRGDSTPFVLELPPYRMPTLRSVIVHCWERTWLYIKKAGTVLVAISMIIWIGLTFPALPEEAAAPYQAAIAAAEEQVQASSMSVELAEAKLRHSFAGRMGSMIEPLTRFAGFDWRVDVAIIGGIAAKEALVSTLGTTYSLGEVNPENTLSLAERLAADPHWSRAKALALMLFVLLYSPCFVALIVIRQEAGSWRWLAFSVLFNTTLAYVVAVLVYQIGSRILG